MNSDIPDASTQEPDILAAIVDKARALAEGMIADSQDVSTTPEQE